jgi:hypothetical protein
MSGTDPVINISVGGGPTVSAVLDTGSTGLEIPRTDVNLASLGTSTGSGTFTYGNSIDYETVYYDAYNTTVNLGNGIVATTNVDVAMRVTHTVNGVTTAGSLSSLNPAVGIGPNDGFPASTPVTSALPGTLSQGALLNEPQGVLEFGPNPLPAVTSVSGAPATDLKIQINNAAIQATPGAFIDSGGLNGAIPDSLLAPGAPDGQSLPTGTTIAVYTSGGQELYSYTVTGSANAPDVIPTGGVFNTGNYPFSLGPIYISNSPSGVGTKVFDY